MIQLGVIALGGAAGSVLRYLVQKTINVSFPFGTLAVNLVGCFFIGWLWGYSFKGLTEPMRLFLMTGFCGGFTTFSAFGIESMQMILAGRWTSVGIYIIASVAGGLLTTFLGYKIFSA
ncbi:MAG TPA: fluoride efflux transporter CrcB [Flavisolibacter sp.]|nr:fluoride efflux transporter CrcB [Flavisolibacter sp.]